MDIRKRLKETKEKVLADREHIKRQKEYDKLSIEKKTELKKKLNDFRQVFQNLFNMTLNLIQWI